jgi:hypothetical protein
MPDRDTRLDRSDARVIEVEKHGGARLNTTIERGLQQVSKGSCPGPRNEAVADEKNRNPTREN